LETTRFAISATGVHTETIACLKLKRLMKSLSGGLNCQRKRIADEKTQKPRRKDGEAAQP